MFLRYDFSMKNILILFLWWVCGSYATSTFVDSSELQGALDVVRKYHYSIGTDALNKTFAAAAEHLLDLVHTLHRTGGDVMLEWHIPQSLKRDSSKYISVQERLGKALMENEKLTSQLPLVPNLELYSGLTYFKAVCRAIENMQDFAKMRAENSIWKGMLPDFEEGFKEHMLAITKTQVITNFIQYVRDNKNNKDFIHKGLGKHIGGRTPGTLMTTIEDLYETSELVSLDSVAANADFKSFIQEIRQLWWETLCSRFWAYEEANKLCPGLVDYWQVSCKHDPVRIADAAIDSAARRALVPHRGDWKEHSFDKAGSLRDHGVKWGTVLHVMDELTKVYIKENDETQEQVLHFLAMDAASKASQIGERDFMSAEFPKLIRIMEEFKCLDITKRKRILLICSAPYLAKRTVVSPQIAETVRGTDLNFLDPAFLSDDASEILRSLHLLELKDRCVGQVVAISKYICSNAAANWDKTVYEVVKGLKCGSETNSFLIKMKDIIKRYCSNAQGFWTKVCKEGGLNESKISELHKYIVF